MSFLERFMSCDPVERRMAELRPLRVRVENKRCAGRCGRCTWIRATVDYCGDCVAWMAERGIEPRPCRWRRR